jgi:hypothetical protein
MPETTEVMVSVVVVTETIEALAAVLPAASEVLLNQRAAAVEAAAIRMRATRMKGHLCLFRAECTIETPSLRLGLCKATFMDGQQGTGDGEGGYLRCPVALNTV